MDWLINQAIFWGGGWQVVQIVFEVTMHCTKSIIDRSELERVSFEITVAYR